MKTAIANAKKTTKTTAKTTAKATATVSKTQQKENSKKSMVALRRSRPNTISNLDINTISGLSLNVAASYGIGINTEVTGHKDKKEFIFDIFNLNPLVENLLPHVNDGDNITFIEIMKFIHDTAVTETEGTKLFGEAFINLMIDHFKLEIDVPNISAINLITNKSVVTCEEMEISYSKVAKDYTAVANMEDEDKIIAHLKDTIAYLTDMRTVLIGVSSNMNQSVKTITSMDKYQTLLNGYETGELLRLAAIHYLLIDHIRFINVSLSALEEVLKEALKEKDITEKQRPSDVNSNSSSVVKEETTIIEKEEVKPMSKETKTIKLVTIDVDKTTDKANEAVKKIDRKGAAYEKEFRTHLSKIAINITSLFVNVDRQLPKDADETTEGKNIRTYINDSLYVLAEIDDDSVVGESIQNLRKVMKNFARIIKEVELLNNYENVEVSYSVTEMEAALTNMNNSINMIDDAYTEGFETPEEARGFFGWIGHSIKVFFVSIWKFVKLVCLKLWHLLFVWDTETVQYRREA